MNSNNNKQTVNTDFKLQHPQDLVSRLFILEYIRELGVETIKDKLTAGEAKFWLYSFKGEEGDTTEYDFNWEYLVFTIPMPNLSKIIERYLEEILKIDTKRQEDMEKMRKDFFKEEMAAPVDINIYDLAQSDMKNQKLKLD